MLIEINSEANLQTESVLGAEAEPHCYSCLRLYAGGLGFNPREERRRWEQM